MFIGNKHTLFLEKQKDVPSARGVSLLEAMIAVFLTAVGIIAIMSLQPTAWKTAAKSDYLGRAAMILSAELERQQARIMNPCNSVAEETTTDDAVRPSAQGTSLQGDAVYSVTTTIAKIGANVFSVTVTVKWNNGDNKITESMVVTRQDPWRFPEGCADA